MSVKYTSASNGTAEVIPSCSTSSSSKEQVYASRHSYDGEVSSGSTAGSFTVTNLTRTLDIKFDDINYTVKTGILKKEQKTILKNISGDFRAGELTAIMGPSGAGKSSLLDILSGYVETYNGKVSVNGLPINMKQFRRQSAYIMQDCNLQPLLTVKEAMHFSSSLKIGDEMSKEDKKIRIEGIIKAIGLENAKKTLTGQLSGGQLKRLAIALELVNNPPVMFFDEPTTGLDSSMSFQCISLLKQLSHQGRTIICTIHQPNALTFEKFDHLFAVAEGSCIYAGSPHNLVPFLSEAGLKCPSYYNPSDYLLEIATNDYGFHNNSLSKKIQNGRCSVYRKKSIINENVRILKETSTVDGPTAAEMLLPSNEALANPVDDIDGDTTTNASTHAKSCSLPKKCCRRNDRYPTSFFKQFCVLLMRTFLILSRDKSMTTTRLVIHCCMAPLIGILFFDIGNDAKFARSNLNYIFFSIMFLMFTAFSAMQLAFPLELPIITREHFNRWYSLRAYYLAMTLADVPIQMLCSTIYLMVTYYMTSQPMQFYRFGLFVTILLMVVFVAQALGLFVGALFSVKYGAIFGPFFISPFLIFSGFFIRIVDAPGILTWLFHVSFLKYALEGAVLSIFGYNRPEMQCDEIFCYYKKPKKFIQDMALDNGSFLHACISLTVMFLVLRVAAFYVMSYRIKHKNQRLDCDARCVAKNCTKNNKNIVKATELSVISSNRFRSHKKNCVIMSADIHAKCNEQKIDIVESRKKASSIDICFNGLTYSSKTCKGDPITILNSIDGKFQSGRLSAILGPSGSGKTSLLNILSGFKNYGVSGKIFANKEPIDFRTFRHACSFITQELALLEYLTTFETLMFAAELKLPSKVCQTEKRETVKGILRLLGLQRCENNKVYHLSGGEKKRLSIGVELITNPSVMFFDEPTSGLDSVSSLQVIKHLRELAHDGRTIIVVVHQPSSSLLQLFDDLYILTNGNCIYNGALDEMVESFQQVGLNCPNYYNRADFALEVASFGMKNDTEEAENVEIMKNGLERLISLNKMKAKESEDYGIDCLDDGSVSVEQKMLLGDMTPRSSKDGSISSEVEEENRKSYETSMMKQILVLTQRSMLCTIRDLYFAQLRVIAHVVVALLLGSVFYDVGNDASKVMTNLSCLFFFLLFIFFANTMPTVLTFPCEAQVFVNQCFLNHWYSLKAYYFSKIIADLPLQLICPTLFVTISYFMTGQPFECDRFLMLLFICVLMATMSHSLGLVAGAAFSVKHGVFLLPATSIPMLIFSGFFIRFDELFSFFKPFTYVSYFRYGLEGSVQAIYGYNRSKLECPDPFKYCERRPDKFLERLDMANDSYVFDVCGLLCWILILQIALFFVLKLKIAKCR
ncbi:ABC transporter G family member 2-like [Culicoides brevitarsis]|uniref:ABC transporter G family member 2-like n=1 Tax=Culicoides brevitarsis TaxID=469753 RepID=UPI00307B20DB